MYINTETSKKKTLTMLVCSRWNGLLFCFVITFLTLGYTIKFLSKTNSVTINNNNLYFAEVVGDNKIKTPKTWSHSAEQEKRLQHLKQFCINNRDKYGIQSLINFVQARDANKAHFFMSGKRKLVYCGVPKVASTNWKRLLLLFENTIASQDSKEVRNKNKVHDLPQQRLFSLISKESVKQVIFHYYKFLFVRHPFVRLVSAYRDKFVKRNVYYQTTFGSQILRRFRENLTEAQYRGGVGVTFEEFMRFITEQGAVFDSHWAPIDKLCHPCVLPYNFIGKMETLLDDAKCVLQDIGSNEFFPANKTDGNKIPSETLMHVYFSTLKPELIEKLYEKYNTDFLAFDYKIPESIKSLLQKSKNDSFQQSLQLNTSQDYAKALDQKTIEPTQTTLQ